MKFNIYITLFFLTFNLNAQLLYKEDFNSYKLGNLGTDPTAVIPGQGNWIYTPEHDGIELSNYQIQWESGKDLYLLIESTLKPGYIPPVGVHSRHFRKNIGTFWALRNPQNNILKFEVEIFTNFVNINDGLTFVLKKNSPPFPLMYNSIAKDGFFTSPNSYPKDSKYFRIIHLIEEKKWQKIVIYYDFNTYDAYVEFPYANYATKMYNINPLYDPLSLDYLEFQFHTHDDLNEKAYIKIDNIKIFAVDSLPTLSTQTLYKSNFNIYPNPTNYQVTITSKNFEAINEIVVYDVTGKQMGIHYFNGQTQVSLNLQTLVSGVYFMHIKTSMGTVVEKIVRN